MHRVALLTGGDSSEREVALRSAETVFDSLKHRVEIKQFVFPEQEEEFFALAKTFDVVIPIFHGKGGEDGALQKKLDKQEIRYVFSGPDAHALGMDKIETKRKVVGSGLKTPSSVVLQQGEPYTFVEPSVLKVPDGGSSIGVILVRNQKELEDARNELHTQSKELLLESFITGREFTVGVVDVDGVSQALPVVEIRSKNAFFDFESKYDAKLVDEICPAVIDEDLRTRLFDAALEAHKSIGAKHLSRSDFLVDDSGQVWFIEINTIPGLTKESLLPKELREAGLDLGQLLHSWINDVV